MVKYKSLYKSNSTEKHEMYVKNVIRNELVKLKYNFNYIGSVYLAETIYLLYSLKKDSKFSLEADIYPIIAKECNCSEKTVKSNIVNATDKMYYDCEVDKLIRYIGKYGIEKPGPKQVAKAVLRRIINI